jgi:predicted DNA-binding protein
MTAKKRRAIRLKAEQVQKIEAYCKARGISKRRFIEDRINEAISDPEDTN